jgi:acetyl esterase/lipase
VRRRADGWRQPCAGGRPGAATRHARTAPTAALPDRIIVAGHSAGAAFAAALGAALVEIAPERLAGALL